MEDTSELTVEFLETVVEEINARLGKVVTSLRPGKERKGLSICRGVYPAKTTVDSLRDHRYHGKLFTRQQLEKLLRKKNVQWPEWISYSNSWPTNFGNSSDKSRRKRSIVGSSKRSSDDKSSRKRSIVGSSKRNSGDESSGRRSIVNSCMC